MFAVVAANQVEANVAMLRMEKSGEFDASQRRRAKREVCVVTPHSPDTVRGVTFEGGVFVDGWCRSIGQGEKHDILRQLELCGLRDCGTLYL